VADTGELQWFQLKPPLKICARCIQLTSGRAGDTFVLTVKVKGFRRLLSSDKPIFRLRKATKVISRPFFLSQHWKEQMFSEFSIQRLPLIFIQVWRGYANSKGRHFILCAYFVIHFFHIYCTKTYNTITKYWYQNWWFCSQYKIYQLSIH